MKRVVLILIMMLLLIVSIVCIVQLSATRVTVYDPNSIEKKAFSTKIDIHNKIRVKAFDYDLSNAQYIFEKTDAYPTIEISGNQELPYVVLTIPNSNFAEIFSRFKPAQVKVTKTIVKKLNHQTKKITEEKFSDLLSIFPDENDLSQKERVSLYSMLSSFIWIQTPDQAGKYTYCVVVHDVTRPDRGESYIFNINKQ